MPNKVAAEYTLHASSPRRLLLPWKCLMLALIIRGRRHHVSCYVIKSTVGILGQVRFVPKVNMAWLHPCIDGVAEAGIEEKHRKI